MLFYRLVITGLSEFSLCVTELESNLVAMGFEVSSDGAVARLPEIDMKVQQISTKQDTAQMTAKSGDLAALRAVAEKPRVFPATSDKTDCAGVKDAKVPVTAVAADGPQPSLYQVIRQRSQSKLSAEEEQSPADVNEPVLARNSDKVADQHPQRESSVKFCLEKNAFISASSAEESQCR